MINKQLIDPGSIVVVGGSNDLKKPGGKVLKNLLDGNYQGKLYGMKHSRRKAQVEACLKTVGMYEDRFRKILLCHSPEQDRKQPKIRSYFLPLLPLPQPRQAEERSAFDDLQFL